MSISLSKFVRIALFCSLAIGTARLSFGQQSGGGLTICWDTSFTMDERDLVKELQLIADSLSRKGFEEVQVLFFGLETEEHTYRVPNGDWEALTKDLIERKYEGIPIFSTIQNHIKHPSVYVFTNGNQALPKDMMWLPDGSYIFNSSHTANTSFLEKASLYSRSSFIDLMGASASKKVVGTKESEDDRTRTPMKGTVFLNKEGAENIRISVQGEIGKAITDSLGNFTLDVKFGDSLFIEGVGRFPDTLITLREKADLQVYLNRPAIDLEEVVLSEDKRKIQNQVVTAHGPKNENEVGYGVVGFSGEKVNPIHTRFEDALKGKVAGLNVKPKDAYGNGGLGEATIRGGSLIPGEVFYPHCHRWYAIST